MSEHFNKPVPYTPIFNGDINEYTAISKSLGFMPLEFYKIGLETFCIKNEILLYKITDVVTYLESISSKSAFSWKSTPLPKYPGNIPIEILRNAKLINDHFNSEVEIRNYDANFKLLDRIFYDACGLHIYLKHVYQFYMQGLKDSQKRERKFSFSFEIIDCNVDKDQEKQKFIACTIDNFKVCFGSWTE